MSKLFKEYWIKKFNSYEYFKTANEIKNIFSFKRWCYKFWIKLPRNELVKFKITSYINEEEIDEKLRNVFSDLHFLAKDIK